jgi:hypothetical protein
MEVQLIKLNKIKVNDKNPRTITEDKLRRLIESILVFPKMLTIRPIVIDDKGVALGGNMRTRALKEIKKLGRDGLQPRLQQIRQFNNKPVEEQNEIIQHWEAWFKSDTVPVIYADTLTEEEKREFIIKDNSSFGAWDWDVLANEWEPEQLEDWGVDVWQPQQIEGAASPDDLPKVVMPTDNQGEGSQQKDPTNSELDVDDFGDKIKMTLEFSIEEHAFIQQALQRDGMTKEQVLLQLLGYGTD